MSRVHAAFALAGLALGFTLSATGFSDWTELHRAFTLGHDDGAGAPDPLRLVLAFGGAVAVAMAGFFLLARRDALPARPLRAGTVPGAVLFGAGWALCGACPAAVLVQLGEGRSSALVTLAGMLAGLRLHRALARRLRWSAAGCGGGPG